jgi:hypothetical protein
MARDELKPPFWRRRRPPAKYDIALLRPATLPPRERFETVKDARRESDRSGTLLRSSPRGSKALAESLSDCRKANYQCDQPFCPICARRFRRWFIGELLRISRGSAPVHIYTVLLREADGDHISELDPAPYRHSLRKRLKRAGLDVPVIGGFEVVYKARRKVWVLHINLVIFGGTENAHENFETSFDNSDIDRPVDSATLNDPAEQLSYVLKFTTYHRPYERQSSAKSPAKPLNGRDHARLVEWMSELEFGDFLFLVNARRNGPRISIKNGSN